MGSLQALGYHLRLLFGPLHCSACFWWLGRRPIITKVACVLVCVFTGVEA